MYSIPSKMNLSHEHVYSRVTDGKQQHAFAITFHLHDVSTSDSIVRLPTRSFRSEHREHRAGTFFYFSFFFLEQMPAVGLGEMAFLKIFSSYERLKGRDSNFTCERSLIYHFVSTRTLLRQNSDSRNNRLSEYVRIVSLHRCVSCVSNFNGIF